MTKRYIQKIDISIQYTLKLTYFNIITSHNAKKGNKHIAISLANKEINVIVQICRTITNKGIASSIISFCLNSTHIAISANSNFILTLQTQFFPFDLFSFEMCQICKDTSTESFPRQTYLFNYSSDLFLSNTNLFNVSISKDYNCSNTFRSFCI